MWNRTNLQSSATGCVRLQFAAIADTCYPMSQVILRCYDFPPRLRSLIWFVFRGPRCPQLALALPEGRRVPSGPGVIVQPATQLPACSHVDVSGISQVPRRSILCLCLGLGPRPNQRSLANSGSSRLC
jgi:hypothetical protein